MKTTVEDILNILGEDHQVQFSGENFIYQAGCVPLEKYDSPVKAVSILGDINALEYLLDDDFEDEVNPRRKLGDQIILKIILS